MRTSFQFHTAPNEKNILFPRHRATCDTKRDIFHPTRTNIQELSDQKTERAVECNVGHDSRASFCYVMTTVKIKVCSFEKMCELLANCIKIAFFHAFLEH